MSFFLISLFHKNAHRLKEYRTFREKRLDLVRTHNGKVITIFQPSGHEDENIPDEIHILEFATREARDAFQFDASRGSMESLQAQAVSAAAEYPSEILIPSETMLATIVSKRPVLPGSESPTAMFLAEQPTLVIKPLHLNEIPPAQQKIVLETVLLKPLSPAQKRLSKMVQAWQSSGDHRVIFAHTYYLMTTNMLAALQGGEFHDMDWVTRLLDRFASYYFDALDKFDQAPFLPATVWRVAFQVSKKANAFAVQHLLLGVNAHINYDLAVTLVDLLQDEWPSMDASQKQLRYEDHNKVNRIIEQTFDEAQQLVIARYSPTLDRLQKLSGEFDDIMISGLIRSWREQAWQHAVEYLDADSWKEKHAVLQETEYIALRRADMIMLRQGPVKMKLLF